MGTVNLWIGIGAGVALLVWGVIGPFKERKIRKHGISVQSTVTNKKTGAKYCEIFFAFQTENGAKIEAKYRPIWSSNNRQYRIGDIVKIAYLPEDPYKIQILEDRMTYVLSTMLILIGVFWLFMMYWM